MNDPNNFFLILKCCWLKHMYINFSTEFMNDVFDEKSKLQSF